MRGPCPSSTRRPSTGARPPRASRPPPCAPKPRSSAGSLARRRWASTTSSRRSPEARRSTWPAGPRAKKSCSASRSGPRSPSLPPSGDSWAGFGGGLYFHGHEIFGPKHVVIHDIELVPDVLTIRRWLSAQGIEVPAGVLPFHRARGVIHLLDARPGSNERVLTLGGSATFPDLASFLDAIVLPRAVHRGRCVREQRVGLKETKRKNRARIARIRKICRSTDAAVLRSSL